MMKQYLVTCPEASNQGLPWKCGLRTHMLESSSNYSVKDLADLQSGDLINEIELAYNSMKSHISETCALCKERYVKFHNFLLLNNSSLKLLKYFLNNSEDIVAKFVVMMKLFIRGMLLR